MVVATKVRQSRATHVKLAISLPRELAETLRKEVAAGHAPSVSAAIARAVEQAYCRSPLAEMLAEMDAEDPLTEEEIAWAREIMDRGARGEPGIVYVRPNT